MKNKLSDLLKNNEHFNKWKNDLVAKLKTTTLILNRDEFIKAEIERVEKEYSKPTIKVSPTKGQVLGNFDYTKYAKLSYDWLNSGQDHPIESIVNNAKNEYRQAFRHNQTLIDHSFNSGEFESQIIKSLSIGVGFLLYRKHLKDIIPIKDLLPQQTEKKTEQESKPDIVENNLQGLKDAFNNDAEYLKAVNIITDYFAGKTIKINTPIFVKRSNIRKLAFALGEIWRSKTNDVITYDYLEFYKKAFSIFSNQAIDRNNLFGCNLYKYSLSKT